MRESMLAPMDGLACLMMICPTYASKEKAAALGASSTIPLKKIKPAEFWSQLDSISGIDLTRPSKYFSTRDASDVFRCMQK